MKYIITFKGEKYEVENFRGIIVKVFKRELKKSLKFINF